MKHNMMLILYISVFLKLISFMLHVVSCYIVFYPYNIYTNSSLKFLSHILCVYCVKADLCINQYVYLYITIMSYTV